MRATFIGSESTIGNCPGLFASDCGTYFVQGTKVDDPAAVAPDWHVPAGEIVVQLSGDTLKFEPRLAASPNVLSIGKNQFLVRGPRLTDPEALADVKARAGGNGLPDHEDVVEIPAPTANAHAEV